MTIRVIHHGQSPDKKIMHGSCTQCGTVIECERGDAKSSPDQREPGSYVDCPVCKGSIWLRAGPAKEQGRAAR